jgi:hypothetical protein
LIAILKSKKHLSQFGARMLHPERGSPSLRILEFDLREFGI